LLVDSTHINKEIEMAAKTNMTPIISKMYCSSAQGVFVVRRRPQAINGGGFVVTDCSQKVAFRVDGCGILGKKDELILRDGNGDALLLIRRKVHLHMINLQIQIESMTHT
jgi:uncharacterized protein YxjI